MSKTSRRTFLATATNVGQEKALPVVAEGQGIAWDRSDPGTMYTILRSKGAVVISRLR